MNIRSCSTGLLILAALLNAAGPADETGKKAGEFKPNFSHVLYPPGRDLWQLLTRTEEAVEDSRFADAVPMLGKLARSLASRDYFVTESTSRIARGFKAEFHTAMDSLPRDARDAYENLFGAESQALLEGAIEQHDLARLESVYQTWQHTRAGQGAGLLLARLRLDRGQPALAVAYLKRLADSPDRANIEPELSVLLARSLLQLRRPDKATAVLDRLRVLLPQATIEVRGEAISLFQEGIDPGDLIAEQASRSSQHAADGWYSFRGHVSGHIAAEPVRLPPRQLWRVAIEQKALKDQWQQYIDRDAPALPVLSPLCAGGHIVIRTSTHLLGIDSGHGRTTWQYPPLGRSTLDDENENKNNKQNENRSTSRQLTQRVWNDASYGRMSSDGSRLFLIDGLDTAADPREIANAARIALLRQQEPLKVKSHNVLVALDLTREGAFLWMVGDETGEREPETAGACFLGPPLPLDGRLYAMVEIDSAAHLMVLDALTGKKQWSLPVAQIDSQQAISKNPTRRFSGATPVYDNGVLICPSSAGAIAAVDLANRSFLWGFQYRTAPQPGRPTTGGWADPTVVVAGENVLVSVGQDDLYCLDFTNGAERWHKRRSDTLYLATAGENVLLIGKHRFSAIRAGDGELAWDTPFVAIPAGGMPSGRGMFDGRYFYLPTTDPELLQIDVSSGTIVARHRVDEALGNLVGRQGSLVSQSPTSLTTFGASVAEQAVPPGPPQVDGKSAAELTELLQHDQFAVREAASQALLKQPRDALESLAVSIQSDDHEAAFRSVAILTRFLDLPDSKLTHEAQNLLRLGSRKAEPGSIVATAFRREAHRREPEATKKLTELGASIREQGSSLTLRATWKGGNEGLVHLVWLPNLKSAELRHSRIDNAGLLYLRGLDRLETLNLNRTKITSQGLESLTQLPKLKTLLLQSTLVDDNAIEHLRNLKRLRAVNLLKTKFTSEGVEKLRAALPELKVLY